MAKKPAYPTKTCPKCSKLIHARSHSHEACGWTMDGKAEKSVTTAKPGKKLGRPKGSGAGRKAGGISVHDIEAVKTLVDRMGAEKVQQLAMVLG
ncbi:hypothetical protein AYO44_17520 [Planctomycetaceae bacterium SCGC AG-212-F19]|nr:hypothetical protein AYO44_17520 [Planctomycetaceae bacterium SCGC AG-212-F19]